MKLLTKHIEEKLKEYPLGSQDGKLGNSEVIAKFFNPTGVGTWYIIEGNLNDDMCRQEVEVDMEKCKKRNTEHCTKSKFCAIRDRSKII